jgi:hypothetical protein
MSNLIQPSPAADSSSGTASGQKGGEQGSGIDWTEWNFPPLLNLYHFRPSELGAYEQRIIYMLMALYVATMVGCLFNGTFYWNCPLSQCCADLFALIFSL